MTNQKSSALTTKKGTIVPQQTGALALCFYPADLPPNNFLKNTHTDRLLKLHALAKDAFLYDSSSVTSLITLIFLGNSIVAFSSLNSISAIALSFQKG